MVKRGRNHQTEGIIPHFLCMFFYQLTGSCSDSSEYHVAQSQFGEAKAKELKAKQAVLAKAKAEPDMNPNLIEVGERVITKEKPKDPIPDVEWW